MPYFLRKLVSKKKKRFDVEGFQLDLAYITPRVIAMGFPSVGREAMFRNPLPECQRFLETRHHDHYKVYNLCAEKDRQYDAALFYGRVSCFPFFDHQACPLQMIFDLCRDVETYLAEDPQNVVVIHCKAGKGRTGLMITCWLLFSQTCASIDDALQFYGEARTHNGKGVTIASQKRYCRYFAQVMHMPSAPTPPSRYLIDVSIGDYIKVISIEHKVLFEGISDALRSSGSTGSAGVEIVGDVKVEIYETKPAKACSSKREFKKLCHVWFNSYFIDTTDTLVFKKDDCDKGKKLPADFVMTLTFKPMSDGNVQSQPIADGPSAVTEDAVVEKDVPSPASCDQVALIDQPSTADTVSANEQAAGPQQ